MTTSMWITALCIAAVLGMYLGVRLARRKILRPITLHDGEIKVTIQTELLLRWLDEIGLIAVPKGADFAHKKQDTLCD